MRAQNKILIGWFLLLIAGGILLAPSVKAQEQHNVIEDADITQAIRTDFLFDGAVSPHLIDIETTEGIVILSGSVNNILEKERASKIAESIKGVRGVINKITVKSGKRSDVNIKADIENALLWDPATDLYEIDVSVSDGVVTLSGEVDSVAEKQLTAQVTKNVRGIKELKNNIEIAYKIDRPDSEIKAEILGLLAADPYLDEELIKVDVKDGKVVLTGAVGSASALSHAYKDAWVAGVSSIHSEDLKIEWWAHNEMKQKKNTPKTDAQIEKIIKESFLYDPRVQSFKIGVNSNDGVVSLSGVVDNYKAKKAAEQDARNAKGVITVYNDIQVRPRESISDGQIAERIKKSFLRDPIVDRFDITVLVRNQKAYLYGDVDSFYEKDRAEDIVSRIKGVADIQNSLSVLTKWPWKEDDQLEQEIKDQLFWSWLVDSDEISVDVQDGIATLRGIADSWHEVYAAVANAFEGGAKVVKSRLIVDGKEDYFPVYHYETFFTEPKSSWILEYSVN